MQTLNILVTVIALVVGVLLIIGKGDIFLQDSKDKKNAKKDEIYDQKKMQRAYGIAIVIIGIATGISSIFPTAEVGIAYLVVVVLAFAIATVYIRKCCKLK